MLVRTRHLPPAEGCHSWYVSITPRKHGWLTRLVLIVCWLTVAGLGIVAISLLVDGLDLRHHAAQTTATVISFYPCCHGGYHATLTFAGPGGRRLTESTTNLASPPTRGARVPVYYVPADPAEFQDARLGPPGVVELVFAAIFGTVALVLCVVAVVLHRYRGRRGAESRVINARPF